MAHSKIIQHPGLHPLWNSIDSDRKMSRLAAMTITMLSVITIGVCLFHQWWYGVAFSVTLLIGGIGWLYHLKDIMSSKSWRRQLIENPDRIVWVYGLVTERMPFGFKISAGAILYLVEDDGTTHSFSIQPDKIKLVIKTLNRILLNAEFGYTPERELKYRGSITRFKGWYDEGGI